jgi:hypothetical protein
MPPPNSAPPAPLWASAASTPRRIRLKARPRLHTAPLWHAPMVSW